MRRNLDLIRGQTLTFSGVLRDDDGTPRDLTDATLTWRVGPDGRFRQTFLTLTESDGIEVTDAANGAWAVTIDPGDTTDIAPGNYLHQGEASIAGAVYGFVDGRLKLRGDLPS